MADYRLDCCGGFPFHEDGCPQIQREYEVSQAIKKRHESEEQAWKKFFGAMSVEEFYQYLDNVESELNQYAKWKHRQKFAMKHMRDLIVSGRPMAMSEFREWQKNRSG